MAVKLTEQEIQELRDLKTLPDDDNIRWKEHIKQRLLNNRKLIHIIDNKELEEADAEPDDYYGINILPYFIIHPTQSASKNYLCYEIQFSEEARYNSVIKIAEIIFYCMSEQKGIIEDTTYVARHDLMAAMVKDEFNWTNIFGCQVHLVSDKPSVTDNDYATRTLIFEGEMPNNLVKTRSGRTYTVNGYVINDP